VLTTRLCAAIIATAGFGLLMGCSASVSIGSHPQISQADVQAQTSAQLATQTSQPKPTVTCPGALDAKVGAKMDCILVAQGDTTRLPVHLTVDSITGSTAHWNIQVDTSPLPGKDSFCADNAKLDKASKGITAAADFIAVMKANQSVIDDFAKNAPADIQADATTLVGAARASISTNDASGFATQAVASAGMHVDAYCGQNSDGSPATTTIPSDTTTIPSDTTTAAP
jgi:hypothetical protein